MWGGQSVRRAVLARVLLTTLVFLGLSIQHLIQRIIDRGINQQNQQVVIETSDTDHCAPARWMYERCGYTLASC
jgi:hypothetical protein